MIATGATGDIRAGPLMFARSEQEADPRSRAEIVGLAVQAEPEAGVWCIGRATGSMKWARGARGRCANGTRAGRGACSKNDKPPPKRGLSSEADGTRTRNHRIDRHFHGSEDPLVGL